MRTLAIAAFSLALGLSLAACGSAKPPEPQTASDPTAGDAPRKTNLPTCRWVPSLPEGREDPCEQVNNGSELNITEREDMRPGSASESKHTCMCQ